MAATVDFYVVYGQQQYECKCKCDIECVENVQRRFTKWLPGFKDLMCSHCLKVIDLESLELHRLYADLIMRYKIVVGLVNWTFSDFFAFSPSTVTRGHQYKIYVNHSRPRGGRKYFFAERVVGPWNSLPTRADFGRPTWKRFKLSIKLTSKNFYTLSVTMVMLYFNLCLLLGRVALGAQRPIVIKLSRVRSVGRSVCLSSALWKNDRSHPAAV